MVASFNFELSSFQAFGYGRFSRIEDPIQALASAVTMGRGDHEEAVSDSPECRSSKADLIT